ncbi:MAG: hypothetical protein AB8B55_22905 [Mariniblastus sp.]
MKTVLGWIIADKESQVSSSVEDWNHAPNSFGFYGATNSVFEIALMETSVFWKKRLIALDQIKGALRSSFGLWLAVFLFSGEAKGDGEL